MSASEFGIWGLALGVWIFVISGMVFAYFWLRYAYQELKVEMFRLFAEHVGDQAEFHEKYEVEKEQE